MEFNRINIKIIEFIASSNEIRRFGVYGKVSIPLIDQVELSEQFIGVHRVIEPVLEESIAIGIKPNYEREYESLIDFSIGFLNRKLNEAVDILRFTKNDQTFLIDKGRINEIKILEITEEDLKKWDNLRKK